MGRSTVDCFFFFPIPDFPVWINLPRENGSLAVLSHARRIVLEREAEIRTLMNAASI